MLKLPPLSLYVHIPWCVQKCPYCDFNSHALKGELPQQEYVTHLLTDLQADLAQIKGRQVNSIFIGGGTPVYSTLRRCNLCLMVYVKDYY